MKALLSTLMIALSLTACVIQVPVSETRTQNNKTYEVSYLFEHDGCKVYRFYDRGHYVYFTNCKGEVTSVENDSTIITNSVRTQKVQK